MGGLQNDSREIFWWCVTKFFPSDHVREGAYNAVAFVGISKSAILGCRQKLKR